MAKKKKKVKRVTKSKTRTKFTRIHRYHAYDHNRTTKKCRVCGKGVMAKEHGSDHGPITNELV